MGAVGEERGRGWCPGLPFLRGPSFPQSHPSPKLFSESGSKSHCHGVVLISGPLHTPPTGMFLFFLGVQNLPDKAPEDGVFLLVSPILWYPIFFLHFVEVDKVSLEGIQPKSTMKTI